MFAKALLLAAALAVSAAAEVKLLRHPAYHKGKIAFSYLSDLWIANEDGSQVQRLTDHKARDVFPRFSPDGAWIAFSSNRAGNYDVYAIPASGGRPRQLTFHTADDNVVGWSHDGRRVIFQSTRGKGAFPTVATLFEVALDGGLEQPLATDWGSWASYSPDGARLAFTRHPGVWSRKHYRGSYAVDLWLMEVKEKKFTRLADDEYKGNCLWPMYGRGGEIYFVADRLPNEKNVRPGSPEVMKSVNNIWKISERGGRPVQVTHHTSGSLFFPSISSDGRVIVYEENFGLWKLDTASGKSSEIRIQIVSDDKENTAELRAIQNEADAFHLSPSTRRAAISTHGEIFTIATERGEVRRVSETFWREQDPVWSPDGKRIAFTSDRTGRDEIWIADERGQNEKKLTDSDTEKLAMVWAPDSKSIVWSASDHKLRRVEIESGKTEELVSSDVGNITGPQFSPDGKWLAYAKPDDRLRPHVWVRSMADGTERMIGGDEFLMSSGARWTPDGKKLLFLAGSGAFSIASTSRSPMQLYSVSLVRMEKNPAERGVDSEEEAQNAPAPEPRRGPAAAPAKVEVKIDWDGLDRRIRQLTRGSESVYAVAPSPDSRTYAFAATGGGEEGRPGAALYTIQEDGERMTRIASSAPPAGEDGPPRGRGGFGGALSSIQWARDGRSIYYLDGRNIYSVAVSEAPAASGPPARGGPGASSGAAQPRRVTFTVRLEVDQPAERRQVFQEAWRIMKNRFYDARMHGVNWAAMRENYEPLLASVGDSDELRNLIMQMIGELNASHTGVSAPPGRDPNQPQTRYPGFELEPDASGFYKVGHIYKKGPADHDYVKLAPGNFVLALNGKELKSGENFWKLYNLAPGRKFEFTVNSKPSLEGAWTVSLEPLTSAAQGNLEYEKWVSDRKAMVERLSKGQVGYLHIRAMDAPSLRRFERDLIENQSKKALIIDQRFNGGGGIDQELLQILGQRRYQTTRSRGSIGVERPARAFFGPMVVMQNERSASDAEMFPDGFRTLGLGKLVGVTTYGAVIGTGSYRLMDGSTIRTPGAGVFTAKGVNMENYGVPPDIYVDNTPADFLAGRDAQIEKAVEVLLGQLK